MNSTKYLKHPRCQTTRQRRFIYKMMNMRLSREKLRFRICLKLKSQFWEYSVLVKIINNSFINRNSNVYLNVYMYKIFLLNEIVLMRISSLYSVCFDWCRKIRYDSKKFLLPKQKQNDSQLLYLKKERKSRYCT